MSEAKKQYEKVMTANDEYISMSIDNRKIRAYVSELEQEKAELIRISKNCCSCNIPNCLKSSCSEFNILKKYIGVNNE